jgi:hypothetical protein
MAWRRPGRQVAVACRILRQRGPFLRGDGEAYHLGGRRVSAAARTETAAIAATASTPAPTPPLLGGDPACSYR